MRIKQHNSETDYEIILDSLLSQNIDVKLVDHLGNSAVFYGIQSFNYQAVSKIVEKGGEIKTNPSRVFRAIVEEDLDLLHGLAKFGDKFEYKDN